MDAHIGEAVTDNLRWRARRALLPRSTAPARHFRVRRSDRFLVSYPRSGNTYLRHMVTALRGAEPTPEMVAWWAPDPYKESVSQLRRSPEPRVIKSHEPFEPRYGTVVYLVRDPRDVALSYFQYQVAVGQIAADADVEAWGRRFVDGLDFGRWDRHVDGWAATADLVLRYEDLIDDPQGQLVKVAAVLDLPEDATIIERAVEQSSADRMRARQVDSDAAAAQNHVGPATSGRGAAELPRSTVDLIERSFTVTMGRMGYL